MPAIWKPVLSALAALMLLSVFTAAGVVAADRVLVEFEKIKTDAPSGLEYEYTFMVKKHGSGDMVEGADFMISTDMAAMPGAHHMPHVKAEPGHHPGAYKAKLEFDMAGEWTLILSFTQPHKDKVVLTDMVGEADGDMKMDHSKHGDDTMDHSTHGNSNE